ncbi:MAG: hypothetical protein DMF77_02975 [Acidobacteria bacterium]|nr:MAG: hypothetical protein DMF77_02975 [Acidobacteriota bacterium]
MRAGSVPFAASGVRRPRAWPCRRRRPRLHVPRPRQGPDRGPAPRAPRERGPQHRAGPDRFEPSRGRGHRSAAPRGGGHPARHRGDGRHARRSRPGRVPPGVREPRRHHRGLPASRRRWQPRVRRRHRDHQRRGALEAAAGLARRPHRRPRVPQGAALRRLHRRLGPAPGPVALGQAPVVAALAAHPRGPRSGLRAFRGALPLDVPQGPAAPGGVRAEVLPDSGRDVQRLGGGPAAPHGAGPERVGRGGARPARPSDRLRAAGGGRADAGGVPGERWGAVAGRPQGPAGRDDRGSGPLLPPPGGQGGCLRDRPCRSRRADGVGRRRPRGEGFGDGGRRRALLPPQGPSSPITVRVIGDAGCEAVEVTGGPEVRVADAESCTKVTEHASLDRRAYIPPPTNPRAPWIPPRDWGGLTTSLPWLSYGPDLGLFLGASVTRESYGFRKDPYASHQRLRGGYATTAQAVRFDYQGDFRHENSGTRTSIFARASGIEILRFYGLGNETLRLPSDDAHKVKQQQYLFAPALVFDLGSRADLTVGPVVQYSTTSLEAGRLISAVQPYGTEDFGQVGGRLGLSLDHRDRPGYPTRGALVQAEARAFPGFWGVRSTFGEVHGEASAYLTPAVAPHPTLALRVGGKRVWGDYPFHEAAYIGGHTTVRGLRAERFGGDASLYGNAELRLALGRFMVLLPGEFGIFGLADAGRVFLEGESSHKWHTAAGGGVWFSFLSRRNTLSLAVATSEERTGLYVDAGFMF